MPLMEISTSRVIEEVRRHTELWNTTHPSYRSKQIRHKAWQTILRTLVPNFDELPIPQQKDTDKAIQQRWKTARDAYMRNKALIKSGATVKKYFYFDQISFLDIIGPGWYEPKPPAMLSEEATASPKLKQLLVQIEPMSPSNTSTTSPPPVSPPPAPLSRDPLASVPQVIVKLEHTDETDNNDSNDALSSLHTELDIEIEKSGEMPVEFSVPTAKPSNSKPRKPVKRKLVGNEINVEVYKLLKKTANDSKDDNMAFFMSMLPIVNKFSDRRKLIFRSEVIRIALELSSKDD